MESESGKQTFDNFVHNIQINEVKFDDFEMLEELTQIKIDVPSIQNFFEKSKQKYLKLLL